MSFKTISTINYAQMHNTGMWPSSHHLNYCTRKSSPKYRVFSNNKLTSYTASSPLPSVARAFIRVPESAWGRGCVVYRVPCWARLHVVVCTQVFCLGKQRALSELVTWRDKFDCLYKGCRQSVKLHASTFALYTSVARSECCEQPTLWMVYTSKCLRSSISVCF